MSGWNPKKAELPHRKLRVWKAGKALGLKIYRVTERFPSDEMYGLRAQLRRASVSVASNIAEGAGRGSNADLNRFLLMARGSLNEVDTQLEFAHELGYLDGLDLKPLRKHFDKTNALLTAFIGKVRRY